MKRIIPIAMALVMVASVILSQFAFAGCEDILEQEILTMPDLHYEILDLDRNVVEEGTIRQRERMELTNIKLPNGYLFLVRPEGSSYSSFYVPYMAWIRFSYVIDKEANVKMGISRGSSYTGSFTPKMNETHKFKQFGVSFQADDAMKPYYSFALTNLSSELITFQKISLTF